MAAAHRRSSVQISIYSRKELNSPDRGVVVQTPCNTNHRCFAKGTKIKLYSEVTVQPGLCIHCTDRMKTQSLRASGPSRSNFQWPDAVTVQWAETLWNRYSTSFAAFHFPICSSWLQFCLHPTPPLKKIFYLLYPCCPVRSPTRNSHPCFLFYSLRRKSQWNSATFSVFQRNYSTDWAVTSETSCGTPFFPAYLLRNTAADSKRQ